MKRLFFLVCILLFLFAGCSNGAEETCYRVITEYAELTKLLQNFDEEMVLLDLRDNREYENAHCIGSINVPFDDGGTWLLKQAEENGWKEKTVYLMCGGGKRSADAFNLLVEKEFSRVIYVAFGYEEYIQAQGYENSEGAGVCDCYQQ